MIDSDLIPETNVLKNKLGITDQTLLDQAEADITYLKLLDIDAFFEGRNLDYAALLDIHKYIFGNLYEWAGTQRNLNIYKAEKVLDVSSEVIYFEQGKVSDSIFKTCSLQLTL